MCRLQCSTAQQTIALLKKDKDYLSKQVSGLDQQVAMAEEKANYLSQQLVETKQGKEALYRQLISDK